MKINLSNKIFSTGFQNRIILFVVPFSILLLYYFAFYPGCLSGDSYAYLSYFDDHHPLFFLIYLRVLRLIFFGFDGYILMNIFLYSVLLSRLLVLFTKSGLHLRITVFFSILFALVPSIGFMMVTYWKDILYGISIFYLSFLLIFYVITIKENRNINNFFFYELAVATLFIIGTRHNGIAAALITYCILIIFLKSIRFKLAGVFCTALLANYIVIFLAFQLGGAKKTWMRFDHIIVKHLSTFLFENKLDTEGKKILGQIMPIDSFRTQFSYYSHDGYAYGPNASQYRENVQSLSKDIRKAFIRNVKRNPMTFLKSELLMTQLIWSPVPIKGSFRNSYCTECGEGVSYFLNMQFKKLILNSDRIDKPLYTRLIFWSGSFNVWVLFVMLIYVALFKGKFWTIPFVPVVSNVCSLFIALVSQDFRYVFSEVLMSFIMLSYLYYLIVSSKVTR